MALQRLGRETRRAVPAPAAEPDERSAGNDPKPFLISLFHPSHDVVKVLRQRPTIGTSNKGMLPSRSANSGSSKGRGLAAVAAAGDTWAGPSGSWAVTPRSRGGSNSHCLCAACCTSGSACKRVGASRQLIVELFPPGHRGAFVMWGRQRIVEIGGGSNVRSCVQVLVARPLTLLQEGLRRSRGQGATCPGIPQETHSNLPLVAQPNPFGKFAWPHG
jgi:hypothetical protein